MSYDPSQPSSDPADYVFIPAWLRVHSELRGAVLAKKAIMEQARCVRAGAPVDTIYIGMGRNPVRLGEMGIGNQGPMLRATPAWLGKNGEIVPLVKMETRHIRNCMAMIFLRSDGWRTEYLQLFTDELKKRGDQE